MNTFFIDTTPAVPELRSSSKLRRNAWISPQGDTYSILGGKHLLTAKFIGIVLLSIDPETLWKGKFFKDDFESHLRKIGWAAIKDTSWITSKDPGLRREKAVLFEPRGPLSQKQRDAIFDYDEKFKTHFSQTHID